MYINLNVNPLHRRADDCTIRAISTVLDEPWEKVYSDICIEGLNGKQNAQRYVQIVQMKGASLCVVSFFIIYDKIVLLTDN